MFRIVLVVLAALSVAAEAQSFGGQASSNVRVVPPYQFCVGADNGNDVCLSQGANKQVNLGLSGSTVTVPGNLYTGTTSPFPAGDGNSAEAFVGPSELTLPALIRGLFGATQMIVNSVAAVVGLVVETGSSLWAQIDLNYGTGVTGLLSEVINTGSSTDTAISSSIQASTVGATGALVGADIEAAISAPANPSSIIGLKIGDMTQSGAFSGAQSIAVSGGVAKFASQGIQIPGSSTGTATILTPSAAGNPTLTLPIITGNIFPVVGTTSQKSETAADTNVLTFSPPAIAGSYRVRFVMSVSAANAAVLGWTVTYKDSSGNAQSPTNLALTQLGTAAPALTFTTSAAGNYHGSADLDIDSSATNIVVKLTFSGTSFAAKVSSTIEKLI